MGIEDEHARNLARVRAGQLRADQARYHPFVSAGCPDYHWLFHDDCRGCRDNRREETESRRVDQMRSELVRVQQRRDREAVDRNHTASASGAETPQASTRNRAGLGPVLGVVLTGRGRWPALLRLAAAALGAATAAGVLGILVAAIAAYLLLARIGELISHASTATLTLAASWASVLSAAGAGCYLLALLAHRRWGPGWSRTRFVCLNVAAWFPLGALIVAVTDHQPTSVEVGCASALGGFALASLIAAHETPRTASAGTPQTEKKADDDPTTPRPRLRLVRDENPDGNRDGDRDGDRDVQH